MEEEEVKQEEDKEIKRSPTKEKVTIADLMKKGRKALYHCLV